MEKRRSCLVSLSLCAAVTLFSPLLTSAQLLVDCHGDTPHPEGVYLEQLGQKLDNHGDPAPHIAAYTQGMFPEVYALDDSRLAWVFPLSEADPATGAVNLGKVWCEPVGEGANLRTPTGKGAVDTRYGFLDGRLSAPVMDVAGFTQEWYENVWETSTSCCPATAVAPCSTSFADRAVILRRSDFNSTDRTA